MYNQPYFIPGYFSSNVAPMMNSAINGARMGMGARGAMGLGSAAMNGARMGAQGASRGLGLFSRLGNSMRAVRGINWGGLITNASKTLNVVNQAIPLVRQVGPMVNNMKSMLRVASIFKDETDKNPTTTNTNRKTSNSNSTARSNIYNHSKPTNNHNTTLATSTTENRKKADYKIHQESDTSPTFFVEA